MKRLNFPTSEKMKSEIAIKRMIRAAHIKIFLNYSQTLTIINALQINWNIDLSIFFSLNKTISGGAGQILTFECFAKGYFIMI